MHPDEDFSKALVICAERSSESHGFATLHLSGVMVHADNAKQSAGRQGRAAAPWLLVSPKLTLHKSCNAPGQARGFPWGAALVRSVGMVAHTHHHAPPRSCTITAHAIRKPHLNCWHAEQNVSAPGASMQHAWRPKCLHKTCATPCATCRKHCAAA